LSAVTDFELRPSRAHRSSTTARSGGWQAHRAGPFQNQGACIAAIVAAN
jgi:hypothetical protein